MNTNTDPVNYIEQRFDEIVLHRLMMASQGRIDDAVYLHQARLESYRDEFVRSLVVRLRGYVWADPPTEIRVQYPASWWEAFKERWFPEWALEAYPIDYEITTLNGQAIYPRLPLTVPERQSVTKLFVTNQRKFP